MVLIIPKNKMPQLEYTPVKYKDEITLMGIHQNGPFILYTDTNEVLYVPWSEIVAYAATAPREELPSEPEKPPAKPPLREVKQK